MTNFHLVLVALTTIVGATIAPASAVEPAGQMVFYDANNGGNCSSCAWIAATGEITEGTAERFERFVQQRNDKMCRLVVMHSPGGLLTEGIRLGYALRKHGCTTTIGRTVSAQIKEAPHLKDVEPGHCYSACAYAFLGGERRWVDATSRYGVHQHFNADAVVAPLAKTLSSLDLSTSQFLTGLLVAYVIEMDVNPLLVTVAAMAAPHEDIAVLDRNALEAMRVVTDITPPMAEWSLVPIANGLVAQVEQIQDDSGSIQRARLLCTSGPGLPQLRIHHESSSSSSSSSGTSKPSSAARNSSDVAASSRLVLMLVLMDLSSRMRLSAMWRTSARLWAM
ncbi:ClpP/crotonase-like domain-containing protein [Aromatoleum bremense]|nr:ClpP/crotonase-like domain-containing protein [Aromatoleum bremense]